MRLSIYDYIRRIYLALPSPPMPRTVNITEWTETSTTINIKQMKQHAVIDPTFPNVIIKENGKTVRCPSPAEAYRYANRFNLKLINHTEKKGQEILANYNNQSTN